MCSWFATEVFDFVNLKVGGHGLHLQICWEMQYVEWIEDILLMMQFAVL